MLVELVYDPYPNPPGPGTRGEDIKYIETNYNRSNTTPIPKRNTRAGSLKWRRE